LIGVSGNANILTASGTGVIVGGTLQTTATNVTLGSNAFAASFNAISIGANSNANVSSGIAIGGGSNATVGTAPIAIGASSIARGNYSIAVGVSTQSGQSGQGNTIAIGYLSVASRANAIAIGSNTQSSNTNSIFIGTDTGFNVGPGSIGIGYSAGNANGYGGTAFANRISIGYNSGMPGTGANAIAIGAGSGRNQKTDSIAIGALAAGNIANSQGNYTIAIGAFAAYPNNQPDNSIVLNASGANLQAANANSFFVKPIRDVTGNVDFTVTLKYNPTTGEIGYV
jgi:hypothetical protein